MAFVTNKEIFLQRTYVYTKTASIDYMKTDARLYIKQKSQPTVHSYEQAEQNSFKMLPSICLRASCFYVLYLE